jgi:penicillin-binding protein 1A
LPSFSFTAFPIASSKRYPVRAALALPALVLLFYVLVLIPFTPGVGDLRKARSELQVGAVGVGSSVWPNTGAVTRRWVAPGQNIAPCSQCANCD